MLLSTINCLQNIWIFSVLPLFCLLTVNQRLMMKPKNVHNGLKLYGKGNPSAWKKQHLGYYWFTLQQNTHLWVYKVKFIADGRSGTKLVWWPRATTSLKNRLLWNFLSCCQAHHSTNLLVVDAKKDWFLKQLDEDNAFLHGLDEDVYMTMPPVIRTETIQSSMVCKVVFFLTKYRLYSIKVQITLFLSKVKIQTLLHCLFMLMT